MKTVFLALCLLSASTAPEAQRPANLNDLCTAIGAANVGTIMSAVDGEVELVFPTKENVYNAAGAEKELRSFFAGFSKTSFGKNHQGASKSEDAEYCIGTLNTDKGSFRVYVLVAKSAGGVVLQELHFERN